jgi:hypothetical protein
MKKVRLKKVKKGFASGCPECNNNALFYEFSDLSTFVFEGHFSQELADTVTTFQKQNETTISCYAIKLHFQGHIIPIVFFLERSIQNYASQIVALNTEVDYKMFVPDKHQELIKLIDSYTEDGMGKKLARIIDRMNITEAKRNLGI